MLVCPFEDGTIEGLDMRESNNTQTRCQFRSPITYGVVDNDVSIRGSPRQSRFSGSPVIGTLRAG